MPVWHDKCTIQGCLSIESGRGNAMVFSHVTFVVNEEPLNFLLFWIAGATILTGVMIVLDSFRKRKGK